MPNGPESPLNEPPTSSPAGVLVLKFPAQMRLESAKEIVAQLRAQTESHGFSGVEWQIAPSTPTEPGIPELVAALGVQTEAINRLAASNEGLVRAVAEADGEDPPDSGNYMDGTPRR